MINKNKNVLSIEISCSFSIHTVWEFHISEFYKSCVSFIYLFPNTHSREILFALLLNLLLSQIRSQAQYAHIIFYAFLYGMPFIIQIHHMLVRVGSSRYVVLSNMIYILFISVCIICTMIFVSTLRALTMLFIDLVGFCSALSKSLKPYIFQSTATDLHHHSQHVHCVRRNKGVYLYSVLDRMHG